MAYYDSFKLTNETIREVFRRIFRYGWYQNVQGNFYAFNDFSIPSLPVVKDLAEDTDELIATVYSANNVTWDTVGWQTARGSIGAYRYGVNFERPTGDDTHVCLLRYKTYTEKYSKADTVDGWLMLSNKSTGGVVVKRRWHSGSSLLKENSIEHKYNITGDYRNATFTGTEPPVEIGFGIFSYEDNKILQSVSRVNLYGLATNRGMSAEDLTNLESIYDGAGFDYLGVDSTTEASDAPPSIYIALPSMAGNRAYGSQIVRLEKAPDWMPVFDIDQVDDIIKFLKFGDDSGRKDVFDINNPDKEVVEDFTSNAKTFITNLNNLGHVQFKTVWYNDEYIVGGEDVWGAYSVRCYERYFETDGTPKAWQYLTSSSTKNPTITLDHTFSPVSDGEYWEVLYEMLAIDDYDENEHLKGGFAWSVRYRHDNSKEFRVKVDSVHVYPNFNLAPTTFASTDKTNIVDGYRYTNETYNKWHEIYFRAITLDDLNGYDNPEDIEDDTSGSDSDFSGASGLRTFSINNTDFETINKKLWSTDWTSVFKSSSIDPVKCVISCKGIPFTADSVSSAEVVIANMDTGLNKNYVKSVKSFNVGSVLMPHYNDDFTDITLTHIRCYLPYIGWVELPASECISRVAYSKVGIEARPKRLKFKYLVDFVDGSVRCVVSVNDTERWFFDGNCSVDIPVTSDNHTQAVSNALRSGLQTGLSIATAVAGAYTSNAGAVAGGVIGAMQNAPNIFPTYSYTATANGSGYINASMNTHIMIVIERPNTIKSTDYAKRVGVPCGLSLNLGSLHGFTVCKEVDVTGIDATPDELAMIKSLLESGVYL
ncbi:MAG: hypothetical protein MJZ55_02330 [Paludibacteraceae bacterium]|nr:hypothetical protein [Paludibacteraceae bacterium]